MASPVRGRWAVLSRFVGARRFCGTERFKRLMIHGQQRTLGRKQRWAGIE